jgi:CMP-N-acetylneuraminic acid synthetase
MKILTIIPAKTDSTRLPKKNIQTIKGKTLVEYSIDYAKQSKYNPRIIVSSESEEVWNIAISKQVEWARRPKHLLKDAEPDREHTYDYCVDYMIENNYDDLITIEPTFKRSGSVRIFKYDHLMKGHVSKRIGCIKDDATDIHYQQDLERATERIQ